MTQSKKHLNVFRKDEARFDKPSKLQSPSKNIEFIFDGPG